MCRYPWCYCWCWWEILHGSTTPLVKIFILMNDPSISFKLYHPKKCPANMAMHYSLVIHWSFIGHSLVIHWLLLLVLTSEFTFLHIFAGYGLGYRGLWLPLATHARSLVTKVFDPYSPLSHILGSKQHGSHLGFPWRQGGFPWLHWKLLYRHMCTCKTRVVLVMFLYQEMVPGIPS